MIEHYEKNNCFERTENVDILVSRNPFLFTITIEGSFMFPRKL